MKFILDEKIVLGEGKFATVFHATLDSEAVAAKRSIDDSRLQAEARFLQMCNHPNVLKYKGVVSFNTETYLVTEFAQGGNLQEKLGLRMFSPIQKRSLVRQICLGLDHVHSKNILHRNLVPGSILFKDSGRIVISDFSEARTHVEGVLLRHHVEGVQENEYTPKSDIYLLALLVFQIFEDKRNVNRTTLGDDIQRQASERPGLDREIFGNGRWVTTILDSLSWRVKKRPTAIEFHNAFRE